MKNKLLLMGIAAIFVMTGIASANLLTNPGFENGDTSGWTEQLSGATATVQSTYVNSGTSALLIDGTADGQWWSPNLVQSFPASAGQQFNLSGYMYQDSNNPIADASFGLFKIEFTDSIGAILQPTVASIGQINYANPGIESLPFLNSGSASDTWLFSEAEGIAPAGTANVHFYLLNVNADPGLSVQDIYFDDVVAIPEPATIGLMGLFGAGLLYARRRIQI